MFADHAAAFPALARVSALETGTKLLISNLDYGVSVEDIKELFSEVGDLKRYSVDYDKSGRSKETAEVVFSRWKDAEAAVKRNEGRSEVMARLQGDPRGVENGVEVMGIRHLKMYLLKTLMLIWRSIMQMQCKQIDGIDQLSSIGW